jgi:alkylation response protein AidB-like acyl-CoA dehydrogenase
MSVVGASVDRTPEGSDYLERARGLVKLIESEAEEGERTRTVTDKVAHALRESGLPWMLVPKSMGGGGLKIFEAVEVTEQIAAADTSAGWILQAYVWGGGLHAGMLPPSGAKRLFLGGNKQTICGSFAPPGRGFIVDGGLKITGRWAFGSGAKHADYIGGGVKVYDDEGNVRRNADGGPDIRFALMRKDQVTLEGNWDVSGLVGTDSQDYSADGVVVPDELIGNISTAVEPNLPDGMYRMGTYTITVAGHASMALGLMRRALKEVAELTRGKERLGYPVPVDEYPLFLSEFAKHEAMYQAARLYVLDALREAQAYADRERSITPELAGRVRQASTWAHQVAEPVITFARVWAGTKGFREPSALARVGRDVAVAVTHVQVDPITLVDSAPALLDAWRSI